MPQKDLEQLKMICCMYLGTVVSTYEDVDAEFVKEVKLLLNQQLETFDSDPTHQDLCKFAIYFIKQSY